MEKGTSRRNRRLGVLLSIVSVLLAAVFCFWMLVDGSFRLARISEVYRGIGSRQELDRVPSSKFRLKQLYRHGVGKKCEWLQKLDMDPEFLERAGLLYQRQMKINERTSDEPLWTADGRFMTDNPFDYEFEIRSDQMQIKRMADRSPEFLEGYLDFAMDSPSLAAKVSIDWIDDEVIVPNITDKDTIISLALMSSNAYVKIPHTGDWRNISSPWNKSESDGFGWDDDGLRGHVFVNEEANIVILSFKGTSAQGMPGSGIDETTANDKINDNLLFSCCCARVSYLWTTVCDCYTRSYTCDEACLEKELRKKDYYYAATMNMYKQVHKEHPNATIWTTGHSLGGSLAALLGRTYGLPSVAFEAPGELLAAKRLHLPFPPGLPSYAEGVWHFGHTADPIFMGTCNGASSTCSIAGYAMETSCHTGRVCVYDVVTDKGWHVNLINHRIHTVIDGVLNDYEQVAQCVEPEPCVDCYNWQYIPERGARPGTTTVSKTTSSTTTSHTATPTSSCLERNWFGICTKYG